VPTLNDFSPFSTHRGQNNSGPSLSVEPGARISSIKAALTKVGMISYIASMCVALPIALFPAAVLYRAKLISRTRKEILSLRLGQFCSRWLIRIIPFAKVDIVQSDDDNKQKLDSFYKEPEPSIWVCNHTSMLDVFFLLAVDKKMRGKKKRPIKIVYWKELEKNPITNILFKMSGFIPVQMADNGNGNANSYDKSSFKGLLKNIKQAFDEGFE